MILGIHHVAVNATDMDRLIAFYERAFGFRRAADELSWARQPLVDATLGVPGSAARSVMLRAGTCFLEIFEFSSPPARQASPLSANDLGYTHLCIGVTDIEAEHRRLVADGMRFLTERPSDFGDIKAIYGKDPDGNLIELIQLPERHALSLSRRGEGAGGSDAPRSTDE